MTIKVNNEDQIRLLCRKPHEKHDKTKVTRKYINEKLLIHINNHIYTSKNL